jgi:cytochrome c-type biogenesis protein
MTVGAGVGLLVAFLGGVVSFASPCCLPLVPAYIGYMVGATGAADRRRSLFHGLAFVTGFTLVFVAFWASIGAIGYALADNARYLRQLGGAILIVLGLQVAGVINLRALWRDTRPMPAFGGALARGAMPGGGMSRADGTLTSRAMAGSRALAGGGTLTSGAMAGGGTLTLGGPGADISLHAPGYGRSLLFGVVFAAGWSPCIGPILGGIIGLASTTGSVAQGTVLLLAYAAGLAVPFLAVAMGATWVARRLGWVGRHHRAVSLVSGAMLIGLGALMVTNLLARLAALTAPLGG